MAEKSGYESLRKRIGNSLVKKSQAMPDDTQFEQDFSKIAFSFIQDRAPGLMKYLLGFETVDRDEDGSRAVGIFGFKVGKDYYYVPAFFLNNQVKGVDMILNKRTNSFVPLTEEWVDEITRRQRVELGSKAEEGVEQDFEDPDFDFLQHPDTGPLGYHNVKFSEAEMWSLSDAWEQMKLVTKEAASDKEFNEAWAGFVSAVKGVTSEKKAESSDLIKEYQSKIGGPKSVISTLSTLENFKYAEAALKFYDSIDALCADSFDKDCYLVKKEAEENEKKIKFTDVPKDDEQAKDVVEDGFTVIDRRKDEDKSVAYTTETIKSMSTPDKPGIYQILMPGGDFKRGFLMPVETIAEDGYSRMPICECGGSCDNNVSFIAYFPDDNKKTWEMKGSEIFVNGGPEDKTPYDEAKDIKDVENGDTVLLVGPENTYIGPVDVGPFEGGKDTRPTFSASVHQGGCWTIGKVELADFNGRPRQHGNVLTVPDDWRFLKLYKVPEKKENQSWDSYDALKRSEEATVGTSVDLFNSLTKNAHHFLHVGHGDSGFSFELDDFHRTSPMSYKQASVELVTRLGLGYDQAKKMLKSAERNGGNGYIVKFAQMVGVNMPMPQEPTPSVDPYTGMPVYPLPYEDETHGQLTGVPEGMYENEIGENVGGELSQQQELPIDREAQMLAQQAAELGQKTVFDQATVGGLSKVYDTGAVIDSYIPQFMESLDRLGRVLFLYYWRHDDFISRYGTGDVVEMEDLLRSTFKTLGKLTIELKKKGLTVDGEENAVV